MVTAPLVKAMCPPGIYSFSPTACGRIRRTIGTGDSAPSASQWSRPKHPENSGRSPRVSCAIAISRAFQRVNAVTGSSFSVMAFQISTLHGFHSGGRPKTAGHALLHGRRLGTVGSRRRTVINLDQVPVTYSSQFWADNGNPLQPFVNGPAGTFAGTQPVEGRGIAPGLRAILPQPSSGSVPDQLDAIRTIHFKMGPSLKFRRYWGLYVTGDYMSQGTCCSHFLADRK
jgi:hypothetical protein